MGTILISLVIATVAALLGYVIGRQSNVIELEEASSLADARLHTIARLRERIDSLQGENDYFQGRTRRLEEQLVAEAHSGPSMISPPDDIERIGAALHRTSLANRNKGDG